MSRVIPTFILTNGEQNGAWCVPFADVQLRSQASLCFDKGGLNLEGKGSFLIIKDRKIDPDQEETYYFIGSVSAFIFFMFHVTPIRSLSLQESETFA